MHMKSLCSRRTFAQQVSGQRSQAAARLRAGVATTDVETKQLNGAAHAVAETGAASQAPVDFSQISDIIRMVNESDIVELELNSKAFKLALRKPEALKHEHVAPAPSPYPMAMYPPATMPPPAMPSAPAPSAPAPAAAQPAPVEQAAPSPANNGAAAIDGVEVGSPMSGTFYTSPAPGEPAFVKEGDRVTKGQVIGIIEAMKLMNEIEAEVSGTVVKMLADNQSAVTPGQPLMIIKP